MNIANQINVKQKRLTFVIFKLTNILILNRFGNRKFVVWTLVGAPIRYRLSRPSPVQHTSSETKIVKTSKWNFENDKKQIEIQK